MGCGCSNGPQVKTYKSASKIAPQDVICKYTLEELKGFIIEEQEKEKPNSRVLSYVKSQINVYNYNCNLFVTKIDELRDNN